MPHPGTSANQLSVRAQVAHLLERGYTPTMIAQELRVSINAAKRVIEQVEMMFYDQIMADMSILKARKISELAAVKRAAWAGWDRGHGEPVIGELYDDEPLEIVEVPELLTQALDEALDGVGGEGLTTEQRSLVAQGAGQDLMTVLMNRANPQPDPTFEEDPEGWRAAAERRLEEHRYVTSGAFASAYEGRAANPRSVKKSKDKPTGDPVFLKLVLEAIAQERALLGLDAARRQLNLNLTPQALREMSDDEIERKLRKLAGPDALSQFESELNQDPNQVFIRTSKTLDDSEQVDDDLL
jgi:hypothetical protein